jgi:hypothetical protein
VLCLVCSRKKLAVTYCTKADDKLHPSYHGFLAIVFVAAHATPRSSVRTLRSMNAIDFIPGSSR